LSLVTGDPLIIFFFMLVVGLGNDLDFLGLSDDVVLEFGSVFGTLEFSLIFSCLDGILGGQSLSN
jgi:hypothetical protein